MEIKTPDPRVTRSESADHCWLDALTEPILDALTQLPGPIVAESLGRTRLAAWCRHGRSRAGSPHSRLLRTLSRHGRRHCRCVEKDHHPAIICYGPHGSECV
jgi:hypothetical protein